LTKRTNANALPPWAARKVVAHIKSNLPGDVRVHELASIVKYSKSHFHRVFWQRFGMAPHRFIMLHRIRRAKRLLIETDESLSQISLACGMVDQAHFGRTFRNVVGDTPRRWRLIHKRPHSRSECRRAPRLVELSAND